jgi:NADPH:quinone reductase-like Zn-dependent oxidoreductase
MLRRISEVKKAQSILVHGAGGAVGTAMLQLGKTLGLEMFGTASKSKHDLISDLGATPIDYKSEDWVERIFNYKKDGIHAVFDPIGGENFKNSFRVLRKGGILVGYGFYNAVMGKGGSIVVDFLRLKLWDLLPNGRSTAFYSIGALRKKYPDWFTEDLTTLFNLLLEGRVKPVIAKCMPLSEARLSHELIEKAEIKGKIVLTIDKKPA